MARDLTSGVITEIDSFNCAPVLFVKMEFDSGDLNVWTGYGDKIFDGDTYLGAGELVNVSSIKETTELEATGVSFTLTGVPPGHIALALSEDYQSRVIRSWLAFLNTSGAIVVDPFQNFKGFMDVMEIKEAGENSDISIIAENALIILQKASERLYNHEEQQIDYPGDLGFEFTTIINDGRNITWGGG